MTNPIPYALIPTEVNPLPNDLQITQPNPNANINDDLLLEQPTNIKKKHTLPLNCRRLHGQLTKKTEKALDLIHQTGINPKDALILASNGKIPSNGQIYRIKDKYEKYRLSHPQMDRLARDAVKAVLKDGEVNGEKASVSAVLAAASMVKDRTEPIIRQAVNLNINAEVSPVDLGKWINRK